MSDRPASPREPIGLPGTVISMTVHFGSVKGGIRITETITRGESSKNAHPRSHRPLFRPTPRRLPRRGDETDRTS